MTRPTASPIRALIVGLGSMGRRHLANFRTLETEADITVWQQHSRPGPGEPLPAGADRVVHSLEDALHARPEAAVVASPASRHVETALVLAQQGIHLLVEKPLSHTLEGVDDLLELCHSRNLTLQVGYNFRFYRPLQIIRQALLEGRIGHVLAVGAEVGQYLPQWRTGADYRQGVSARSDLGGGAVLELSHELDYCRWLAGEVKSVSAQIAHLSDLEIDVEDTAEIILQFNNGAIGSVHLDMVQRSPTRSCRIIGAEGTIAWDGNSHQVRRFSAGSNCWEDMHPARELDRNEMYLAELQHFLEGLRGPRGGVPQRNEAPTGEDGRRVLEIALAAKQSSMEQRVIRI